MFKRSCLFDNINNTLPDEICNENVIRDEFSLRQIFESSPEFILGLGGPTARLVLYNLFLKLGGIPQTCVAPSGNK